MDKPSSKRVLVSGVTGQDGSYMVDYLLAHTEHIIYGMVRRTAKPDYTNITNALRYPDRFKLITGDLSDSTSIDNVVKEVKPDYFINLGAQSFVGSSWTIPEQTFDVDAIGVIRCLEAIRKHAPKCRFYNAGSSEEYGSVVTVPQDETHPPRARSPYGAAKVAARQIVKVYRESYGLYAIQGLLFNHECLTANTPVIIRDKQSGLINILPIEELVPHRKNRAKTAGKQTSTTEPTFEVWDGSRWAQVFTRTATWNDEKVDKKVHRVMARGGYYEATEDHISFLEGGVETFTKDIKVGSRLELKPFPDSDRSMVVSVEMGRLLGLMAAEGYVDPERNAARFTNKDEALIEEVKTLWSKVSYGFGSSYMAVSGFTGKKDIIQLDLVGDSLLCKQLRADLYTEAGLKKVPQRILNASQEVIKAFLEGYNLGDGLKAGHQRTEFKSFTTSSPMLAAGLWYLVETCLKLRVISCPEVRGDSIFFHLNVNSDKIGQSGKHLKRDLQEVTKVQQIPYKGWLFDLETDSKTFCAGFGHTWVHNSERRGEEFVTRKITLGIARILRALKDGETFLEPIHLGNIDAKRDWSHAEDFVDGIWKMLNQEDYIEQLRGLLFPLKQSVFGLSSPLREYVLSSDETHTVREFIEKALTKAGALQLTWVQNGTPEEEYLKAVFWRPSPDNAGGFTETHTVVRIDPAFYRPAEVDLLLGSSKRARTELGWSPKVSFDELVNRMVDNDLAAQGLVVPVKV